MVSTKKEQAIVYREDGTIIEVDCFIKQNHTLKNKITKNKVESGIDINDHVEDVPAFITLQGITSDYTISFGSTIDSVKSLVNEDDSSSVSKSFDTFTAFKDLKVKKELVTIATHYDIYENMILTGLKFSETKNTSDSIEFTCDFEELRVTLNVKTEGENLAGSYAKVSADADKRKQAQQKIADKDKKNIPNLFDKNVLQSWYSKLLEWIAETAI